MTVWEGQPRPGCCSGLSALPSGWVLTSAINLWMQCWPGPWQASGAAPGSFRPCHQGTPFPACHGAPLGGQVKATLHPQLRPSITRILWVWGRGHAWHQPKASFSACALCGSPPPCLGPQQGSLRRRVGWGAVCGSCARGHSSLCASQAWSMAFWGQMPEVKASPLPPGPKNTTSALTLHL